METNEKCVCACVLSHFSEAVEHWVEFGCVQREVVFTCRVWWIWLSGWKDRDGH